MSRNNLLILVIFLFVVLALVLFSRQGTNTQAGIVSPTPVQGTINSDVTPGEAMEAAPTTEEVTTSPAVSPSPSVSVTISPSPAQ